MITSVNIYQIPPLRAHRENYIVAIGAHTMIVLNYFNNILLNNNHFSHWIRK